MKQGNKAGILATLLKTFGHEGADHMLGKGVNSIPIRGRNRGRRIRTRDFHLPYKPAMSAGFRGSPRSTLRPGSVPAPTIDQVRRREIFYGQRLHVKQGLMFFKSDGIMFTRHEALRRQHDDWHQETVKMPTIEELEAIS